MTGTELKLNLEFDKTLEYIAVKCVSELGKLRLLNSDLYLNREELYTCLTRVEEVKQILTAESGMPIWSFSDIRTLLHKIEPAESYLEPAECQLVQNLLELTAELCNFFDKFGDKYPNLDTLVTELEDLTALRKLILNTIEPSGAIYDNASPELKNIRQAINVISKQIHIKLDRILQKQAEHLQDTYVTLREGRLVLPVREFSVKKVPGIVHGQSATGQTYFVEPFSVVTLNNEMHELYIQEKREIINILKRLSGVIRENNEQLLVNLGILVQLDVLQSKAQYALATRGIAPEINDEFVWEIVEGYHPLLLKKIGDRAVPVSVAIGNKNRIIIITGPNAGGKTVTLKTIGLLQMLFQSGFHIPVKEKSRFPICKNIFAVIGDEQSIENDLSTFSSHITKLNRIIDRADDSSLILIDEIGTGTDPSEGSALAIAMLEQLNRKGIVTLVTTHHGELKLFAHKMEYVQNAAMQFDRNTLAPKFKFELGVPGSSYAFDISRRLGVKADLLERAQEILGTSHHELEEMIVELSNVKQAYEERLANLSLKESELNGFQALYRTRSEELHKKKKLFEKDALQDAQKILDTVNKTIETVIREIRESKGDAAVIKSGREKIERLKTQVSRKITEDTHQTLIDVNALKKGMPVKSRRFAFKGQIIQIFKNKNEVEIEANGIKLIVPVSDLIFVDTPEQIVSTKKQARVVTKHVVNEIDLRGMLGDDALIELEKYLDVAIHSQWQEIRIIHGKGTGALRQKVHQYLKKNK